MNNIQELYKNQKFLIAIKHNSLFNYSKMIEVDEDEKGVHITIADDLNKYLKADEKKEVIKMIYNDLKGQKKRKEIEGAVIVEVEERLERYKERVRKDIGLNDILKKDGLSDPRD